MSGRAKTGHEKPFVETWIIPGTSSDVRPATEADIVAAEEALVAGKCPCNIVYDEPGFAYDIRYCYTCGKFLGMI